MTATMKTDLSWYFRSSATYLGLYSSFTSFKFRMEGERRVASTELNITDGMMKYIRKFNRIHHLLLTKFTSEERAD